MIKKVAFRDGRLLSVANQSNLKSIQKAMMARKIRPTKKPLLFCSCKQAISLFT